MLKFISTIFPPLIVQILILLVWHILAILELFPPTVLIPPLTIVSAIKELAGTGELWQHLSWSLRRVAEGFALGGGIGFILGGFLGVSKTVEKWIGPTLDALKQVPVFAWGPLMIVVFGIDEISKIAFIAAACFYPVLLSTYQGVRGVQKRYIEVATVFDLSRWETFRRISIPSALPVVITGVRQALALAWMAVVGAEIMGAESGIGFLMIQSRLLFQIDYVLAGVLVIGIVGITINALIEIIEKKFVPWGREVS
jgi:sulfonate transport system permease protein